MASHALSKSALQLCSFSKNSMKRRSCRASVPYEERGELEGVSHLDLLLRRVSCWPAHCCLMGRTLSATGLHAHQPGVIRWHILNISQLSGMLTGHVWACELYPCLGTLRLLCLHAQTRVRQYGTPAFKSCFQRHCLLCSNKVLSSFGTSDLSSSKGSHLLHSLRPACSKPRRGCPHPQRFQCRDRAVPCCTIEASRGQ